MKFEIILPLLCFLFDPLTKALQDMEFYDKLVDRFQDPGLARKKKADTWSPFTFFYPRRVVSYR